MHAVDAPRSRGARKSIRVHTFWCDRALVVIHAVYACMHEMCAHAKMFHSFQHSGVCARTPSRAFVHRRRSAQSILSRLSLFDIITGDSLCVFAPAHLPVPVHLFSSVVHLHLSRTHSQRCECGRHLEAHAIDACATVQIRQAPSWKFPVLAPPNLENDRWKPLPALLFSLHALIVTRRRVSVGAPDVLG